MSSSRSRIGLFSATMLVAASMIGVGIYTTSGYTYAALGSPWYVILAWIVGGLIAICGALGYASLARQFTESGGEYLLLSRTLDPIAGLIAGWVSLLWGFTGALAAAALGFEEYLAPLLEDVLPVMPDGTLATAMVLAAALVHTVGIEGGSRVQNVVVVLKLVMIAVMILFAFWSVRSWQGLDLPDDSAATGFAPLIFANQLVFISFSYAGFNAAVYISGEIKRPRRNVPRAMIAGTILVTAIYVVLNMIFVLAPSPDQITRGDKIGQIATTAATAIGGELLSLFVRCVVVVSLASSISALVMSGPRVYSKMADDGFFPRWFQFTDRVPAKVIWFQAALAIGAISIASLQSLLGYLGLTLSVCSALTVSMLFVPQVRRDIGPQFLWGIPAAIYVIATLGLAILYGYTERTQAVTAAISVVAGMALVLWLRRDRFEPE